MSESESVDRKVRAKHATYSVLRERIVEHVFIGDVMRRLWQRDIMDIEVLRAEFDVSGYDLVMSSASVLRHIQLKVSLVDGARSRININLKLGNTPSGCVIWIIVDHDLKIVEYRWFGGPPGKPLPDLSDRGAVRQTRANAHGEKAVRDGQRSLLRSDFVSLDISPDGPDAVIEQLFGIERPKSSPRR